MEAVCIDGTVIECDQVQYQNMGLALKQREPKQRMQSGGSSGKSGSGGQSQSGGQSSSKSKSGGKSKSGKSGSRTRTIGFVPYDKLMSVVPEETTHQIDDLEELPVV